MYVYIYVYIYMYVYICMYVYIYMYYLEFVLAREAHAAREFANIAHTLEGQQARDGQAEKHQHERPVEHPHLAVPRRARI